MSTSNSVYEIRNGEGIIPVGTKKVVANAFRDCQNLFSVKIPEGVTSIGMGAFRGCTSLTDLSLPSTLEFLDDDAFFGCESLTRLELPKSLESIHGNSFSWARIDELVLPFSTPSDELIESLTRATIRKIVIPKGRLNAYVRAIENSDIYSHNIEDLCNALVEKGGLTYKVVKEIREDEEETSSEEKQTPIEWIKENIGCLVFGGFFGLVILIELINYIIEMIQYYT
jgi:hypothetical protein